MYDVFFTGDCFAQSRDGSCPFNESIQKVMHNSANVCINLETTIGAGGKKVPKAYNFQVPKKNLGFLKNAGINITSVANNHSMDYGEDGFNQTLDNLNSEHFFVIGAKGEKFCSLRVGDKTYCISAYYGVGEGGVEACSVNTILPFIEKNRDSSDVLVVCLHWGDEYSAYPKPRQQQLARTLIENGVDVVIGHHPHVIQGVEEYKGKFIFYSLGNFNFNVDHPYHNKLETTKVGFCVGLYFTEKRELKYDIIPVEINRNWQPDIMEDETSRNRFRKYLTGISKSLRPKVTYFFYYSHSSHHIFKNYYPSWRKQIKDKGFSQIVDMVKWHFRPSTFVYYAGLIMSLFTKKIKY